MLPIGVTTPATVPQMSEIPEGLKNYPVLSAKDQKAQVFQFASLIQTRDMKLE
jgi:hypothetical protein